MCFRKVRQKDVQRCILHRGYEESKIAYVNPPGAAKRLLPDFMWRRFNVKKRELPSKI